MSFLQNRYFVKKLIKRGAMGSVYLAEDNHTYAMVAVKEMTDNFSTEEDKIYAERKFQEEARILSCLSHSGIPRIIDFFVDKTLGNYHYYMVMSYIPGNDIENILETGVVKPDYNRVLKWILQILDILYYLHNQKPPIIYRDIKPSNIIVSNLEEEKIYLVDFGIAKIFSPRVQGTIIGTPGYAPPEQYKGYADNRSDIYSLGVLIHQLLTGVNPCDPSSPPFSFEKIKKYNSSVPNALSDLVESMLSLDPNQRPSNVVEIKKRIETIINGSEIKKETTYLNVIFCPNCGKDNDKSYNFCKKCGKKLKELSVSETAIKPIKHDTNISSFYNLPECYQKTFERIERNNGQFVSDWNWSAFLFGPLWYFSKGMWVKGIVISLVSCCGLYPICWVYAGVVGNYDYYLYIKHNKQI